MLKKLISLVFLLVSLGHMPVLTDMNNTVLPKIKPNNSFFNFKANSKNILPEKKPSIKLKEKIKKVTLPKNKPATGIREVKKDTNKNLIEKTVVNKEKGKIEIKKEVPLFKEVKILENDTLLLPAKKPVTFQKKISKQADKSQVLSTKDYAYAKEIFTKIDEKNGLRH